MASAQPRGVDAALRATASPFSTRSSDVTRKTGERNVFFYFPGRGKREFALPSNPRATVSLAIDEDRCRIRKFNGLGKLVCE